MHLAIVSKPLKNEVLAYISDDEVITRDDVEVIDFGDNEPVFEDVDGHVRIKENSFFIQSVKKQ